MFQVRNEVYKQTHVKRRKHWDDMNPTPTIVNYRRSFIPVELKVNNMDPA